MRPYYDDGHGIVIYHGDCRDVLPGLAPVDLLLTDPPYGLGIARHPFRSLHAPSAWDDRPVDGALLASCIAHADAAIIWGGNYFGLPAHQRFLVWDKLQPELFTAGMCEQAWTNLRGPAKLYRQAVVAFEKWHPTQKPVELMRWCLGLAPAARTVLDPFMGTGTTLRAAKDCGRAAIGIEIEERYCEVAAQRLSQMVLPWEVA